ncbi:MAG: hypothetical protein HXX09_13710 [Bacteroidetes bacterium]|nr:hypothetical protein [Bacteroidota bacterium]
MKQDTIVYHEPECRTEVNNLKLLRITLSKEHTKIDFGYQANDYYIKGGWVKIGAETFIRMKGSKIKYRLIKGDNIPIGPEKHHFKTTQDWLYFSLYFPEIPIRHGLIELIENEPIKFNDFNFWDILLDGEKGYEVN